MGDAKVVSITTSTPRSWHTRTVSGQVDDAQVGVGGRLGEEEHRVVAQGVRELLRVRGVDHRALDAELHQVLLDELPGAAVAVAGHHQVTVGGDLREEERSGRTHARGEEHRLLGAFEVADLALHGAPGGVPVAAVLVAGEATLVVGLEVVRVGKPEGAGLVDGRGDGVALAVVALAAVNGTCGVTRERDPERQACDRSWAGVHPFLGEGCLAARGGPGARPSRRHGGGVSEIPRVRGSASTGNHPVFSNPKLPK